MKEINIEEVGNIHIGQVEDAIGATGCTVIISEEGMTTGLDVRGGGPASRESELLDPLAGAKKINAIVLAGGSAFGLDCAGGVMQYLEEHDIGYDVVVTKVPLVCESNLFDLTVGSSTVRPDKKMGYEAAKMALESPNYKDGNYGVGCGATVGKICGMERCMKSGIGSYAAQIGELKIGAIVVVNALGDIFNTHGEKIAGLLNEDKTDFASTLDIMESFVRRVDNKFTGNTTIGCLITNAVFNKSECKKIAGMAHDGYARTINPVHTLSDGDSIYTVSIGNVEADLDLVGEAGAEVMSHAIENAIYHAASAYGFIANKDLPFLNVPER